MKHLLKISVLLLALSCFVSCKDEEPQTDLQRVQTEIQSITKAKGITHCTVTGYFSGSAYTVTSDNFTLSNGILTVEDTSTSTKYSYNLQHLTRYVVSNYYINFYFNNIYD